MVFTNRNQAGMLLAEKLSQYKGKNTIIYAIPRGGVAVGDEIAKYLNVPLDFILARKIGHPFESEYAIAAISENGHILGDKRALESIENNWLQNTIQTQREEIKRRRNMYLIGRDQLSPEKKIAILVDDGIATGYTFRVAIQEIKSKHPEKIIAAVPVVSKGMADIIQSEVDELVTLTIPSDEEFLGAIGSYYEHFPAVEDQEVLTILGNYKNPKL